MEQFKTNVIINSITTSLISGKPLSKKWICGDKDNNKILEKIFGVLAYRQYIQFSEVYKQIALKWYETHGQLTSELYGAETYEEWAGVTPGFEFDIVKLSLNTNIYETVVIQLVNTVYSLFSKQIIDIMITKFIENPKEFSDVIKKIHIK